MQWNRAARAWWNEQFKPKNGAQECRRRRRQIGAYIRIDPEGENDARTHSDPRLAGSFGGDPYPSVPAEVVIVSLEPPPGHHIINGVLY